MELCLALSVKSHCAFLYSGFFIAIWKWDRCQLLHPVNKHGTGTGQGPKAFL